MKRAHRKSHIALWIILTPVIVGVTLLAILHRPDAPVNETLPEALIEEAG